MKTMSEVFENIYKNKTWVKTIENPSSLSGPGSFPEIVENYLKFIKNLLDIYPIKSVVDYGCGDCAIYKNFDWGNINYTGVDVSSTAINLAKVNLKKQNNVSFFCGEILDLPPADLLIVKDVLGHWSGRKTASGLGDQRSLITEFLNLNKKNFSIILVADGADRSIIESFLPPEFLEEQLVIRIGGGKKILYLYKNLKESSR